VSALEEAESVTASRASRPACRYRAAAFATFLESRRMLIAPDAALTGFMAVFD
jgi:hypothetical protein